MARSETYDLYRPDGKRILSPGERLDATAWRASADALREFLSKSYSVNEIERALSDAVKDKRFSSAALYNQRINVTLYLTVSRLLKSYGISELPWTRELDKLLDRMEHESTIRSLNVDFMGIMVKLIRNGAFDHLHGLVSTIVSVEYLPGVRRLLRKPHREEPTNSRQDTRRPPSRNGANSPRALPVNGRPAPIDIPKAPRGVPIPTTPSESSTPTTRNPESRVRSEQEQQAPNQTDRIQTVNHGIASVAHSDGAKVIPTASLPGDAIIQTALQHLSQADIMPFVAQYDLLNAIIRLLERACFFWAKKTIPEFLDRQGWHIWQRVPISAWLDYLSTSDMLAVDPGSLSELRNVVLPGLSQMRKDVDSRNDFSIYKVAQNLQYAKTLVTVLSDEACIAVLSRIIENLSESERFCATTRRQRQEEFQTTATAIRDNYIKLMEEEIKSESIKTQQTLEKQLESCNWSSDFEAPSDEYYAGNHIKGRTAVQTTRQNTATPSKVAQSENPIHTPTRSFATESISTPAVDRATSEGEATTSVATNEHGAPSKGTPEYETFWTAFRNSSNQLPPKYVVREALDLDAHGWETLRQYATQVIEANNLLDLRWKDIQATLPVLIQNFKDAHVQTFRNVKSPAFLDLLCELTFHSARRGILERIKRRQKATKEDEPSDPRLRSREARIAKQQDEIDSTYEQTEQDTLARARQARIADLKQQSDRLHALKVSTSAANRQSFTERRESRGYSPNKRSLSPPSDERRDTQKKVKIEAVSQDDCIRSGAIPESPEEA